MAFDFDEIINRRIPGDIKYMPVNGRDDILPLWVADMDFRVPDCVGRALIAQAEYSVFGYQIPDKEYDSLVCEWQRKQFQWSIKAEYHSLLPQSAQDRKSQNIFFSPFFLFRSTALCLYDKCLHQLKIFTTDDWLVNILENHPVFFGVVVL